MRTLNFFQGWATNLVQIIHVHENMNIFPILIDYFVPYHFLLFLFKSNGDLVVFIDIVVILFLSYEFLIYVFLIIFHFDLENHELHVSSIEINIDWNFLG